jgi:hypothetical protein
MNKVWTYLRVTPVLEMFQSRTNNLYNLGYSILFAGKICILNVNKIFWKRFCES